MRKVVYAVGNGLRTSNLCTGALMEQRAQVSLRNPKSHNQQLQGAALTLTHVL